MSIEDAEVVGIVGSPSSTNEVTLDIVGDAAQRQLVGSMVFLEQHLGSRIECALGTVAEVVTINPWHENIAMRGVIATHGHLANLSGGNADVRGATVTVQAVYARNGENFEPTGAFLSMSPSTGVQAKRVTDEVLSTIVRRDEESVFYIGDIYRMPGVRLPLNVGDFAGTRGAFHAGVFGPPGVGKTAFTAYYLAGQMRHDDLGILIVDPQHQWTNERDLFVPLQSFARALGREVLTFHLATELRLPKNAPLFIELLAKTPFFSKSLVMRKGEPFDSAIYQATKFLKDRQEDWTEAAAVDLLDELIGHLLSNSTSIYKTDKSVEPFQERLEGFRQQPDELLSSFAPVLSLFAPVNLHRRERRKTEWLLHRLLERTPGQPRPLVILDLSAEDLGGDDGDVRQSLDSDSTKARILRELFNQLERIARDTYRSGEKLLNTMVVFDEAWRYAPRASSDEEVEALSERLAGYARETRKYGVGWMYVLQHPHTLNRDIWELLSSGFRAIGYGLAGADLNLVKDHVDGQDALNLYMSFPQPTDYNPHYPFMLVGGVSPLSFTKAPVFVSVYTDFKYFSSANAHWASNDLSPSSTGLTRPPHSPALSEDDPFM